MLGKIANSFQTLRVNKEDEKQSTGHTPRDAASTRSTASVNYKDKEKDAKIAELLNELKVKDSAILALNNKVARFENAALSAAISATTAAMSPSGSLNGFTNSVGSPRDGTRGNHRVSFNTNIVMERGKVVQKKMGTRGSILTSNVLEAVPEKQKSAVEELAHKFIRVFQSPEEYIPYLKSETFASDLIDICETLEGILEEESRCLFLQSPVYVFGDIHGNLEDLHFFADNIWKLGMDLTAGQFLFLGDYVDRGTNSLEVVAYLFGLKVLYPSKIHLLRGNHETRDVNGWEEHYAEKSFLFQCKDRFGTDVGNMVWEECNQAFDRLPFSAVIDQEIFCIHGGIPRPVEGFSNELQAILALPNIAAIMPSYEHETDLTKQISSDCIWSDPASEHMEHELDALGFGPSPRGGGAMCFGSVAITNFLESNNLSYIIRAHEAHAHGVSISKGARVFTVFSTSKDHKQGQRAMAGCVLVDTHTIKVINRSPKYKNKYVHRRTSISVDLTEEEINDRVRLGLIRQSLGSEEHMRRLLPAAASLKLASMAADEKDSEKDSGRAESRRPSFKA